MPSNTNNNDLERIMENKPDSCLENAAPEKRGAGRTVGMVLLVLALVPLMLFTAFLLLFCADTYAETTEVGDLTVAHGYYTGVHHILGQNHAAVVSYNFDGEDEHRKIVIPDYYNGVPIRELGGYLGRGYPMEFVIEYRADSPIDELAKEATQQYVCSFSDVAQEGITVDEVIYDDFELYLGRKIRNIDAWEGYVVLSEFADGRTVAYCKRFEVTVDEKNWNYYSEDGVLYNKGGAAVKSFIYVGQELKTR